MNLRAAIPTLFAAVLTCLVAAGCGYTVGWQAPDGVDAVAVPVFDNQTARRGFEFPLTEEVVRQVNARTTLRVERDAPTMLRGEILDVRTPVLTEGELDEVRERRVSFTVRVRWVDLRDGEQFNRVRMDRTFTRSREVTIGGGISEQEAVTQALGEIAEEIVRAMEASTW